MVASCPLRIACMTSIPAIVQRAAQKDLKPSMGRISRFTVDRAIEVSPFPLNFHVGLVKTPAPAHWRLPTAEVLFKLWSILDHLAIGRGMIPSDTPLAHHFL